MEQLKHRFCGVSFTRYDSKTVKHQTQNIPIVSASVGGLFYL